LWVSRKNDHELREDFGARRGGLGLRESDESGAYETGLK